jgi:hypothetical protein
MFGSMRKLTVFGFVLMTLGVIPVAIPQPDGVANHMYGDDPPMTDEEYATWLNGYELADPCTPNSPHPDLTDEGCSQAANIKITVFCSVLWGSLLIRESVDRPDHRMHVDVVEEALRCRDELPVEFDRHRLGLPPPPLR